MTTYPTTTSVASALDKMLVFPARRNIRMVCDELSIFDWWKDNISIADQKAMRAFIRTAEKAGYHGYVCFKVGAKYCASGMWAYRAESTDGYSPDGDFIYRSFQSSNNYWDASVNGELVSMVNGDATYRTAKELFAAM